MFTNISAQVRVDCARSLGTIRRVWASIGYDELNWTYTPRGTALYRVLGDDVFTGGPYDVRMHNTFTSGTGLSRPAGGGGNPYHEMPQGLFIVGKVRRSLKRSLKIVRFLADFPTVCKQWND